MEKILKVHSVNDYARYIGAPVLHPLVSVIHYDELEHCRHSLNNYDVYGLFIGDERLEELSYGQIRYTLHRHALMCVAPGQIGGKTDTGEEIQTKGWALLFDPELLHGTDLGRRMTSYTYFSYNTSEALLMSEEQRQTVVTLLEQLRRELVGGDLKSPTFELRIPDSQQREGRGAATPSDDHTRHIIVHYIGLVLEYVARFYARQLATPTPSSADLLSRFESLLHAYYAENRQRTLGLPTVKYCAQELFLSPNYFGDLIRQLTGDTASNAIRRHVMQHARQLLTIGHTITETADLLGFEYPQHFTRMFKQYFGITPSAFLHGKC